MLVYISAHMMDFITAKCGYPTINSPVAVVGYGDNGIPANVGTTVNFICPPDLSLIGKNSTTCAGNEEWKPDPSVVICTKGNKFGMVNCRFQLFVNKS